MMRIGVLCLLLLVSSNASALFEDDQAREQIDTLRQQIEGIETRIATMEETLESQALLELYSQVETLNLEIGRLRGQIEELTNDIESLQKRQKDFYIDLDTRLRQIEDPNAPLPTYDEEDDTSDALSGQSGNEVQEKKQASQGEHSQQMAPDGTASIAAISDQDLEQAGMTEKQIYDAAYSKFANGDYVGAQSQFEAFLNQYPDSSLAPSATYWIGNAHYAQRDFQDAINAQQNLIDRYPDSSKVPDALLNIASSQIEMSNNKAAKETLGDLITRYPFSNAAEKAKRRLDRL